MLDLQRRDVLVLIGGDGDKFRSGKCLSLQNLLRIGLAADLKHRVIVTLKKISKNYLDNVYARLVFV